MFVQWFAIQFRENMVFILCEQLGQMQLGPGVLLKRNIMKKFSSNEELEINFKVFNVNKI